MLITIKSKLAILLMALICLGLTASGAARLAVLSQATESETSNPAEAKEVCHQKIEARRLSLKPHAHGRSFAPALEPVQAPSTANEAPLPRPRQLTPPPLRAPPAV